MARSKKTEELEKRIEILERRLETVIEALYMADTDKAPSPIEGVYHTAWHSLLWQKLEGEKDENAG